MVSLSKTRTGSHMHWLRETLWGKIGSYNTYIAVCVTSHNRAPSLPTIKHALDQRRPAMQLEAVREAGGRENNSAATSVQQRNSAGICVHAILIPCARACRITTTLQELIISVYRRTTLQEYLNSICSNICAGKCPSFLGLIGHGIQSILA